MNQIANTTGLTENQLEFYKTFGYVVLRGLFSETDLETIRKEFDYMMAEQYAHTPYNGSKRHWTPLMDEDTPFFASLMEDPRFLTVAKQLYGDDVLGVGTDANRYTGNTGWHRDTHTVDQYGVKFAFYLQPVTANTGALRVIPGTHRLPDDDDFVNGVRSMPLESVPATALASEPGDVVAFDLRMWHASYGGSEDRHMCTVVYYANPKNASELEALRKQGEGNVNAGVKSFNPRRQYLYSKKWVSNPHRSPDRQYWIDRLKEIGYFDAPGLVEA
ncbi:MAG: phytanoyl-CoA dioxygenase family protein [Candidatus Poribacteria bacterium]|nr:phytanoyl-CoA dioxygenase family protein [Candidatus Poribacteria bacterium]